MIRLLTLLCFTAPLIGQSQYTALVNPFVGTDGHGHTFPGATAPFGMVQLSPATRIEGWDACGGYHYSDSSILGFTHTHLSGTGVADYGDILLMPMAKNPSLSSKHYRSAFSHDQESASPGLYRVFLHDDSINVDLTATTRVGVHRYRFPDVDSAFVIINLQHGLGPDIVIDTRLNKTGAAEITGFRRSRGWAKDQHLYFVAHFSLPIQNIAVSNNDSIMWNSSASQGNRVKAAVQFATDTAKELIVKVALSSVDIDGARKNLLAETPGWDFEEIHSQTERVWNNNLGKIDIRGGTIQQRRTFYTALYHCMIAPNTFSDVDGRYRGMNGKIQTTADRTHYSVFSLWDTFRALHPLLTIIDEKRTGDFVNTMLAHYDESGLLPVWELCSNETWCMIGYHSVSVIADAIAKKIPKIEARKSLAAMIASAEKDHFGLAHYRTYGYIPGEKESESVSKTLEYAYDDWCIARTAEQLGEHSIAENYFRRSQYFRNVFDPQTGFMRGKKNGAWTTPFTPASVSLDFTEANSWQYSFFVPHDIDGMISLYGGRNAFIQKLDSLFLSSSMLEGRRQSDITGMIGQYAHGNEPSHHMAYLYTYAGASEKTQLRVSQILNELYSDRPDGLSGNEDCGQMSAWYVFSAMGMYQVTPGNPEYVVGSPLFDTVTIRLEHGRNFTIRKQQRSPEERFVQSILMNKQQLTHPFISHKDVQSGSSLTVVHGKKPMEQTTVTQKSNVIPFTAVPFFSYPSQSFIESLTVSIHAAEPGTAIFYTTDGSPPTLRSKRYHRPIILTAGATIRAVSVRNNILSAAAEAAFTKTRRVGSIALGTQYSDQYTAGGNDGLIDGILGVEDFRVGRWQGYHRVDLDATITLDSLRTVNRIAVRFLQDNNAWIFFPTHITYEVSIDGAVFENIFSGTTGIPPEKDGVMIKSVEQSVNKTIRYIRIRASNIGVCPSWHKGNGEDAWLFADEIIIE